jgi:acetylornithine deacetylase/succinyl-diaminopimelate desuccinylase-like protein
MHPTDMAAGASSHRAIDDARRAASAFAASVAGLAGQIAMVPAPTGGEHERARVVADLFRSHGITDVSIDAIDNVVARLPGRRSDTALLIAAHTDTVFPAGTPIQVRRTGDRMSAPGIGDNSLGVAAVVLLPTILDRLGIVPAVDLLLTGNVGEEGAGNLRGIRAVMNSHQNVAAVIAVEGHNLGRVTHVAVGSRRLRVSVTGPGGHSWGDYGRTNAIHTAADVIHDLSRLPVPRSPKTTLSVGTITGGLSVNTIPPICSFDVDMRSTSESALRHLGERVDRVLGLARNGARVSSKIIGERPAGTMPFDSPIVRSGIDILTALGVSATADASSTDANIAISRGIPAVCIGLTTGGNVHREDEFIDLEPLPVGLAQLALLTAMVSETIPHRLGSIEGV